MLFSSVSRVLVQGINEPLGLVSLSRMCAYGTNVVAGVAPGSGGQRVQGIPVYDMIEQAIAAVGPIDVAMIYAHPYDALDAALEAMRAGIRQLILISQGMPPLDMVRLIRQAEITGTLVVGPNTPGVIVPGQVLLGLHPAQFYQPGEVALLSRNGPLTYEIAYAISQAGFGQSIAVSIGSDAILGSTLSQWLQMLDADPATAAIVLVGEAGGDAEEIAAQYIATSVSKPVVAYIAGHTAPRDRRLGHAGAILESQGWDFGLHGETDLGTAASKVAALKRAGVPVAISPADVPKRLQQLMQISTSRSA
jgi:succinyl-CoA synthetase alpha subunit